jgi:pyrroline-5-carboxylate reductase
MNVKISCIGSGNMGVALMKGAAGIAGGGNIGFADAELSKAKEAAELTGSVVYQSNTEAAANGDYIFLAVKPQVLRAVLEEIAPPVIERLHKGQAPVLVSMAAGWSIKKIQDTVSARNARDTAPPRVPTARIMPNTPALISQGMIALAASDEVPSEKMRELETILGAAGMVDRVDEKYFDAVTGLSGSGPAFVYMFIEALADGAVRAGLPRDKALRYAAQTVLGSAAMVAQTGKHPAELKDMVTSPGGTTIAGLAALESGAFRGTVMRAVEAAWQRAAELG